MSVSLKLKATHSLPSKMVPLPTKRLHVKKCQVLSDYGFLCVPHAHLYLARQLDNQETGSFSSRSISMFPVCFQGSWCQEATSTWFSAAPLSSRGEDPDRGEFSQGAGHRSRQHGLQLTYCALVGPDQRLALSTPWHMLLLYLKIWFKSQKLNFRVRILKFTVFIVDFIFIT